MKYQHYDIDDYLTDPQFQDWVRNPTAEKNLFWNTWMNAQPTHREKMQYAKEILLSMRFHHLEEKPEDYEEVLESILQKKKAAYAGRTNVEKPRESPLFANVFLSRAAILLLCLLGAWGLAQYEQRFTRVSDVQPIQYRSVKNPRGQRSAITLPDGSTVFLNAESTIVYPKSFSDSVREVTLQGEAFFEVRRHPGKQFIVKTSTAYTSVLGTSFNVRTDTTQQIVEISLLEGEVAVTLNEDDASRLTLSPGEKAIVIEEQPNIQRGRYDYRQDIAWKDGELYFKNASYEEVISRLEKWYNVEFVVRGETAKWSYNGSFKNSSIDKVMERLAYVQNFSYEIQGKKVYLTFNNSSMKTKPT